MSIAEKLQEIADNEQRVYAAGMMVGEANGFETGTEYGKQAQYDEFWDLFQDNGNRTDYQMAFASKYWNDDTFKPKYDLAPSSMFQAFYTCGVTVLPVALTTSNCGNFSYAFCSSKFTSLGVIDFRKVPKAIKIGSAFYGMPNCVSIEKVYLHGGDVGDSFQRMSALVEIRLEGELVTNVNLSYSPKLSKASIESFVAALSDTTTDKILTLSKTAVNTAFETSVGAADGSTSDEWTALLATKNNWTITLT